MFFPGSAREAAKEFAFGVGRLGAPLRGSERGERGLFSSINPFIHMEGSLFVWDHMIQPLFEFCVESVPLPDPRLIDQRKFRPQYFRRSAIIVF